MGFFNIFSGKTYQEYELKGDRLYKSDLFGDAKLEYEAGLHKLEKKAPDNISLKKRFQKKILKCRESLARQHMQRGDEILDSDYYEEAEDIFRLALELTEDGEMQKQLKDRLQRIRKLPAQETATDIDRPEQAFFPEKTMSAGSENEVFEALCGSFSHKGREAAYQQYGESFKQGFLALNQGDFPAAEIFLSRAMEENNSEKTYIPLELATACLNQGKTDRARGLLEAFLENHPDSETGYQLLAETYWEMNDFARTHKLLQSCPEPLSTSVPITILKGETLLLEHRFQEAKSLFQNFLSSSGWNEQISLSLARAHEALDEKEIARDIYGSIINNCSGCGAGVHPEIKRRYAEMCLACDGATFDILQLYFSLIQEDPDNRRGYHQRISEIYSALGDEEQAETYENYSKQSDL